MPRSLLWTPPANGFSQKDADTLLASLKPSKITKRELVTCTVCDVMEPHNMRYRLRRCNCRACAEEALYVKCPWREKTLHCQKLDLVDMLETGKHVTSIRSTPEPRLTPTMKTYAREMTAEGLKPVRIRNGILRKFNLAPQVLPLLATIQRFCQHYASTKLGSNDYIDDTSKLIRDAAFDSSMDKHESFTFAPETDSNGKPVVGVGSDHKPFIVGVTSRRLLMRASGESGALMLHVDAAFKLNQVGYPVIVVGVSDRARAFHLVALFVSSQRTEVHYRKVFAALSSIYRQVLGKPLEVHLVMGDADVAQLNGIRQGLEQGAQVKYLMCFYHAIAKVFEKTRGLLPSHANAVMSGVYDMHCALDESAFTEPKTRVLAAWAEMPELATFFAYFQTQWLSGRFTNWQIFNNPVEQYNRTIKRQYTLHGRL